MATSSKAAAPAQDTAPAEPYELPDGVVAQPLPMSPFVERAEDSHGTRRIVGVPVDSWEPAPTDPDPDQVAWMEARYAEVEAKEKELNDKYFPPADTSGS